MHGLTPFFFVCSADWVERDEKAQAAPARRARGRDRPRGALALSGDVPRAEPHKGGSSRPETGVAGRGRWLAAAPASYALRACSLSGHQAAVVAARARESRALLGGLRGRVRTCTSTVYALGCACDTMSD